jgi:hypothetical protein
MGGGAVRSSGAELQHMRGRQLRRRRGTPAVGKKGEEVRRRRGCAIGRTRDQSHNNPVHGEYVETLKKNDSSQWVISFNYNNK